MIALFSKCAAQIFLGAPPTAAPGKPLVLADGTPLTVHRFDDHWISAARGDTSYELDRQNGNLAYASSTTKDGTATIIVASGHCEIAAGPTK